MTTNTELIARLRSLETDHKPDGWPAIQMRDMSALLDAIEALESEVEAVKKSEIERLLRIETKVDALVTERDALQAQLAAAQGQLAIPVDVKEVAEKMQKNGYRGPMSWIENIIDFVADYAAPIPQQAQEPSDFATIAGLEASVSRLSSIVDEQLRLLIDVEKECGTDGYGGEFEDGESVIIDRVRAHIACYAAPIPQQPAAPTECCEHCDDGDGLCFFPMYGSAPHAHDTSNGWIGSTRTLPKDQWGNNFREDPDCEGHGVYMRCEKCGRGEQPAAAAPQPKEPK